MTISLIGDDLFSYGIPRVGVIEKTHYSWYPSADVPFFDSHVHALDMSKFPLSVWSEDAILGLNGPTTEVFHPTPCGVCAAFTRQMYMKKVFQNFTPVDEVRCAHCVEDVKNFTKFETFEDFGRVLELGNSGKYVVWTTGFDPILPNDIQALRRLKKNTYDPLGLADPLGRPTWTTQLVEAKRKKPLFLLPRQMTGPKLVEPRAKKNKIQKSEVSYEYSFDWKTPNPERICPVWLLTQFRVRPRVSLEWWRIFEEVNDCDCSRKLKYWNLQRKQLKPEECEKDLIRRLGDRPGPTFLCCGKDVSVSFLNDQIFARAKRMLDLPPGDHDRFELMRCNDFLKLYYTLFSVKGEESCFIEACSWRGSNTCVPSHNMFFGSEKISLAQIRDICMEMSR